MKKRALICQLMKEKNIFIFCLADRIGEVFYDQGSTPPLKAKSWLGAWRHVSMCSSGLSTLNNRVGIIHILHSSRFTMLTLNRNQLFESHYSINPLYKKKMRVKLGPQNDPK